MSFDPECQAILLEAQIDVLERELGWVKLDLITTTLLLRESVLREETARRELAALRTRFLVYQDMFNTGRRQE